MIPKLYLHRIMGRKGCLTPMDRKMSVPRIFNTKDGLLGRDWLLGSWTWDQAERKCSGGLRPPSLFPKDVPRDGCDPWTMWSCSTRLSSVRHRVMSGSWTWENRHRAPLCLMVACQCSRRAISNSLWWTRCPGLLLSV